jgi:predicted Holliday junction resolvase-like endonuclease
MNQPDGQLPLNELKSYVNGSIGGLLDGRPFPIRGEPWRFSVDRYYDDGVVLLTRSPAGKSQWYVRFKLDATAWPKSEEEPASSSEPKLVASVDERISGLEAQLAEAHGLLGEERANHQAQLKAVQDSALSAMRDYKAKIDLENAEAKVKEAKATAQRSRVALVAKISEHFAPLLAGFPYNFKDARHVGELFDFLVFDGLEDGEIRNIVFLEVKAREAGSRISNKRERLLRDAVIAGRVRYEVFNPDVSAAKIGDIDDDT